MSDHQPFRSNTRHLAFLTIPCVSLAFSLGAFCFGAPAKLARVIHGPAPLEYDATIRYEPATQLIANK